MHEASLVQGLLNVAFNAMEEHNARVDARRAAGDTHAGRKAVRITRLACSLGPLSCVEPRTLTACFERATPSGNGAFALPLRGLRRGLRAARTAFCLPRLREPCPPLSGRAWHDHDGP